MGGSGREETPMSHLPGQIQPQDLEASGRRTRKSITNLTKSVPDAFGFPTKNSSFTCHEVNR